MTRRHRAFSAFAAALALLAAAPAFALHRESPPSLRITSGGPNQLPPTRSWGNYLAFPSTTDLLGRGITERQVYMWNLADFDCNRGTTKRTTPCHNPPQPDLQLVTEPDRHGNPDNGSANTSGIYVTFDADGVYGGGVGPQSHRRQIFLQNRSTGELLQITQHGGGDSVNPTINRTASIIVFESTAPLLGVNAPPGVRQLFVYFIVAKKLVQITNGAGPSTRGMPDAGGDKVVFQSTADLLGDGHDTGIIQIYVAILNKDDQSVEINQITRGNQSSQKPWITENKAARIVFESTATDLPGTTPGPGSTIYSAPAGEGSFPSMKQITGSVYGSCDTPAIDAGGQHISFVCDGDPLQNHTTGRRAFLIDTTIAPPTPGTLVLPFQLTGRGNVVGPLSHNLGIFFLAFAADNDTSRTGGCGPQIQIMDYYTGQPGHWHPAAAIGEVPPDINGSDQNIDTSEFPPPASNFLGTHTFDIQPTTSASGSFLEFTTQDGTIVAPTTGGKLEMHLTPHDVHGESTLTIPAASAYLPPIPIPPLGVMCLDMVSDANGALDCDGGRPDGDLLVSQDHDTRDVDKNCQLGCAEDDPSCQDGILGPHTNLCPSCAGGVIAMCNGKIKVDRPGTLSAGGMSIFMPMRVRISEDAGVDRVFCTGDDSYLFKRLGGNLELTTETASASIADADANPGFVLQSTPLTGAGIDCTALKHKSSATVEVNGTIPVLDVPIADNVTRDVILGVHIEARSRPLDRRAETHINNVCRSTICANDADCDDGNPCNGAETCRDAACQPGVSLCDDGDPCNGVERCDPATGTCGPGTPLDCNTNSRCSFDTCQVGVGCVHVNPCDDNNACNGIETCDPQTGACRRGTALTCNDNNACTDDLCDPTAGCTFVPNSNPCNDGNLCTTGDVCTNGACAGTPTTCNDGNVCNGTEVCNPTTGTCTTGTPLSCDDGNPCTDDACDPVLGCTHTPNANPCDDGNLCTSGDVCIAGLCTGVPTVVCVDDGDPCNGVEACNPATGTCASSGAPNCDDGNACTIDSCAPGSGCQHAPNTGAACDDNNNCTTGDVCGTNGLCAGTAVPCSDGDLCNGVETCDPVTAACLPGTPLICNDNNVCTDDTCDPILGCVYTPNNGPGCIRSVRTTRILPTLVLLQGLSPEAAGGTGTQRKLGNLLHKADDGLRGATKGTSKSAQRKLNAVKKRLRTYVAMVEAAKLTGRIDPTVGDQLIDRVAKALADLQS